MTPRRAVLAGLGALAGSPGVAVGAPASAPRLDLRLDGFADLAGWCARVSGAYHGWWAGMTAALASPEFRAPPAIVVRFTALESAPIAATDGATIAVNAPYVRAGRGSPNLVCHELAHVAQRYPPGTPPGWLTEGIADRVRYYLLIPDDPERAFDPAQVDWRRGYQPAAALLDACERRRPGTVRSVNAAMRRGENGAVALTRACGAEPEALWRAFLAGRTAR